MQLFIKSGPGAGQSYNLGGKPITLGTDPASEIPVADPYMAGQHARFEVIGGSVYVTDLASDKGTFLNGQRMSPAARYPLRADDVLQIGSTFFQIQATPVAPVDETAVTQAASGQVALQPYQYQISTAYSAAPTPAPAPAPVQAPAPAIPTTPVKKTRRGPNWSALIAAIFILGLLGGAIFYFVNSSTSIEIRNAGQVTRTFGRPTSTALPPTTTPDQAGALFRGPTPGIGADTPITPVQVGTGDLPVYPAARRIDNPSVGVFFTQYVTGDSFDKVSSWAKPAFADKGWTNLDVKALPGKEGAVLTGRKGNLSLVAYLLGPGQKDTAPYDNFFKSANVNPDEALIVINITNI